MKKTKRAPRAPETPETRPTPAQPDPSSWAGTAFRAYVTRIAQYFVDTMFLRGYRVTIEYHETILGGEDGGDREVLACVRADHPYMSVKIEVARGLWDRYNQGKLDEVAEVVCHEFCHVVQSGLYGWAERAVCPSNRSEWVDAKERVTTWMTRAMMQLVPKDVWGEEKTDGA